MVIVLDPSALKVAVGERPSATKHNGVVDYACRNAILRPSFITRRELLHPPSLDTSATTKWWFQLHEHLNVTSTPGTRGIAALAYQKTWNSLTGAYTVSDELIDIFDFHQSCWGVETESVLCRKMRDETTEEGYVWEVIQGGASWHRAVLVGSLAAGGQAEAEIQGPDGTVIVDVYDWFLQPGETLLDETRVEIQYDKWEGKWYAISHVPRVAIGTLTSQLNADGSANCNIVGIDGTSTVWDHIMPSGHHLDNGSDVVLIYTGGKWWVTNGLMPDNFLVDIAYDDYSHQVQGDFLPIGFMSHKAHLEDQLLIQLVDQVVTTDTKVDATAFEFEHYLKTVCVFAVHTGATTGDETGGQWEVWHTGEDCIPEE